VVPDYELYTGIQPYIRYDTNVKAVSRSKDAGGPEFIVSTDAGRADGKAELGCDRVVVATGYAQEFTPEGVQGMDLVTPYGEHDVRPEVYSNKSVLILGMGNTAFETAQHIMSETAYIHMVSRTSAPRWAWYVVSIALNGWCGDELVGCSFLALALATNPCLLSRPMDLVRVTAMHPSPAPFLSLYLSAPAVLCSTAGKHTTLVTCEPSTTCLLTTTCSSHKTCLAA